ncbi:efflux RND transporter periplasmic adaptor subunit [Rhizobium sp. S152]|uniref:efflux RND transporter periplasmic adaptor subunit n=1 Tax=Rhizobium sp. S152 TaxID=3055038 RepID=UPI0025A94E22|nr:efflux RND transporter periplasmic adaptor subunit [Rhizobium sp. S152]MDM9625257.1 efflux RND transporter periplasmic adaptor subunit [Rhizobium sp. S152]
MGRIYWSVLLPAQPVVGALCFWLTFFAACQSAEQLPVSVVIAKEDAVTRTIPVVGSLVAREEVQVYPLIEGPAIEQVLVEVGQTIQKGEPLARFDTTQARMLLEKNSVSMSRARAAVAVEESKLEVADVKLKEALKVVERNRALQPKGAVSTQVLEEYENAYARAVAERALAQQSLVLAGADAALIGRERKEIELTIERSTVRAPESGLVLRRAARVGAMTADTSGPLFVIARDASIEFVAQVTETSFVQLREGMRADISVAGHDGTISGVLRLNAAELDPMTRSGEVRIALDDAEGLKPGMFARGIVQASTRRNIVLPGSAVRTASGASSVFIVENEAVVLRGVTLGARQDGVVEIVDGIRDGDMVVLKSGGLLKVDEKVKPVVATSGDLLANRLASSLMLRSMEIAR